MNVRTDPAAEAEAVEAPAWYEKRQPGLGFEFLAAVDAVVQSLRLQQDRGSQLETLPMNQPYTAS